ITGTNLKLGFDDSASITSPFAIQFGGGSFTKLTISSGGTISFSGFTGFFNSPIPYNQTSTLIAPFWATLFSWGTGTNNNVFWSVIGTAPNRSLVVEWRNVAICCIIDPLDTVKFQVVFFEGSGNVRFNYADTVFGGPASVNDNGATATVGVQVTQALGRQFSFNQPLLKSQSSLLWYPIIPSVALSTSTLDFGYHQIGTASNSQKLTLTNASLDLLQISSIVSSSPDFAETNNCGTSLGSGKSCVIMVTFNPSQPVAESATLTINDNTVAGSQTVTLNGTGSIQPIVVFPIQLTFGTVSVGTSRTLPVTLANGANQPLTIQTITVSPGQFTQSNNCGTSLMPGASCTINVTFAPASTGSASGSLSMGLNSQPASTQVKMSGSGF
ncbi:MAG TPA: choice-of-anchor D domain-containing protein, partial [Terriglobales bacterium]|nr:choice-of-anchor D domain-containing protein [Terriglobales bacterium]